MNTKKIILLFVNTMYYAFASVSDQLLQPTPTNLQLRVQVSLPANITVRELYTIVACMHYSAILIQSFVYIQMLSELIKNIHQ